MTEHLKKRFDELLSQSDAVTATKQRKHSEVYGSYEQVEPDLLLGASKHVICSLAPAAESQSISSPSWRLRNQGLLRKIPYGLVASGRCFTRHKKTLRAATSRLFAIWFRQRCSQQNLNRQMSFLPLAIECRRQSSAALF